MKVSECVNLVGYPFKDVSQGFVVVGVELDLHSFCDHVCNVQGFMRDHAVGYFSVFVVEIE